MAVLYKNPTFVKVYKSINMKVSVKTPVLFLMAVIFAFASCEIKVNKSINIKNVTADDFEEIELVIRKVMKWSSENETFLGFQPIYDEDRRVVAMDMQVLEDAVKIFKKTNLFDEEFTDNYKKLIESLDHRIKTEDITWEKDGMLPYAQADPWCNCQDIPYEDTSEYWNKIDVEVNRLKKDKAEAQWYWDIENYGREDGYGVELKKQKGTWRISYLEGFDLNSIP